MSDTSQLPLHQIASSFKIEGEIIDVSPLGDGLINDTFIVATTSGRRYVLQRVNRSIFRDMHVLQNNLKLITDHIRTCLVQENETDIDRKVLTPVNAKNNELWVEYNNESWRMTRFIDGSVTHTHVTPEMARLTGEAFAKFHSYFARKDAPQLQETIPDFHNLALRLQALKKSMSVNIAGRVDECKALLDDILRRADEMLEAQKLYNEGLLPLRIAHCDTKLNNILFDEQGNILCVIDLDTTMPGFVLSDFGDFIRTAANTGKEDDENLDNVRVNMEIFKSFAEGYVKNASFLTQYEKDLLPFGAKMLTYMQAVRFLTDYLDGDIYYKILYPQHNLIRTKAQMQLLYSIDKHFDEMQNMISNI